MKNHVPPGTPGHKAEDASGVDLQPHSTQACCAGAGSTISTLLHDRINPKDCQVLFLGDTGVLQFFRVVSRDYGKPRTGDVFVG